MTDWTTTVDTPIEEQVVTDDSMTGDETNAWGVNYEEKYKTLQSDYTRKAQKLAEYEKMMANKGDESLTDEEKELKTRVHTHTKDEFERVKNDAKQEAIEEMKFNSLLQDYPKLRDSEEAIRELQKATWMSFEEVAIKYKFTSSDELSKLKNSRIKMVWVDSKQAPKTRSLSELTSEEYAEWKAKNIPSSSSFDRVDGF